MVKQPVITERFRISGAIDVSIGEAGALLAALTKMGFQNIGHELVTDVHTYKRNGKRAEPGPEKTAGSARDDGLYQRTDIKAPAPPAKKKTTHSSINGRKKYDVSNRELMLQHTGQSKTITLQSMSKMLADAGRPAKSASPMVYKMSQEGLFKATKTPGEYTVTALGSKAARNARSRARAAIKPAVEAEPS